MYTNNNKTDYRDADRAMAVQALARALVFEEFPGLSVPSFQVRHGSYMQLEEIDHGRPDLHGYRVRIFDRDSPMVPAWYGAQSDGWANTYWTVDPEGDSNQLVRVTESIRIRPSLPAYELMATLYWIEQGQTREIITTLKPTHERSTFYEIMAQDEELRRLPVSYFYPYMTKDGYYTAREELLLIHHALAMRMLGDRKPPTPFGGALKY